MSDNLARQYDIREELIGGRVVAMSPRPAYNHNRIAFRIAHLFESRLEGSSCTVIADGTDLFLTEKDNFVPDMMVVCDQDKIRNDGVHGAPDLVVEVLSPRTAQYDRGSKKDVYERCGVKEYWIVDPANQTIEQYLLREGKFFFQAVYISPNPELGRMTEEEQAALATHFKCSLYDDFEISVADIFQGILRK